MCNILLVDMNAFYASVHQALDPSLRGKPVIVCGDPEKRHGIVLAASYEAKKYGVKTTMPNWEAKRLVPNGIFIKPEYKSYSQFSERIMDILRSFSPLVEQASIDEAFLDVSGCNQFGNSVEIATKIKKRIRKEVGVLCSVGIGPNKLVAKMAADYKKPDGLTLLTQTDFKNIFWPLPVKKLFGVGAKTAAKLNRLGIYTIGELANFPPDLLKQNFGVNGKVLNLSANGLSYSPVDPHSKEENKSIGNQLTLRRDYIGVEIRAAIIDISEKVGLRLRQGGYSCKTVTLILRDTKFTTHSWSVTLSEHTDITEDISTYALKLFSQHWPKNKQVRLVGVSVSKLIKKQYEQVDLFSEKEKFRKLNNACDEIKGRFGTQSIIRGVSLTKDGVFNKLKDN